MSNQNQNPGQQNQNPGQKPGQQQGGGQKPGQQQQPPGPEPQSAGQGRSLVRISIEREQGGPAERRDFSFLESRSVRRDRP